MRKRGAKPDKDPPTVVAKPPPEAGSRVGGDGPWGPTPFELPDPEGNRSAVLRVAVAAGAALCALVLFLTWFYFHIT